MCGACSNGEGFPVAESKFSRTIHKPQEWTLSHNALLIMANETMLGQANI
jgi:hypothetical protein